MANSIYRVLEELRYAHTKRAADNILCTTHPWLSNADAIVQYIETHVPASNLHIYAKCMYFAGTTGIVGKHASVIDNATLPGMVGAVYGMHLSYPCFRAEQVSRIIYRILETCMYRDCSKARECEWIQATTVDWLHKRVCTVNGVKRALPDTIEFVRICTKALELSNNAQVSAFSILWYDNYYANDCLTTWLPREMTEEIVELLGQKGYECLI